MNKKLRKTYGKADAPSTVALMRLIETQSKTTIANWTLDYAERTMLPLFLSHCLDDNRPAHAIAAAREWLDGKIKLPYVKNIILNECHAAARELNDNPVAQAAARAIGQSAGSIHAAPHSLGLLFYAAAAVGYDRLGFEANKEEYEVIAEDVCADYTAALRAVAVESEPNPAVCKWHC
ncbi:MAG: hypothetical protein LBF68_03900 [Christensenellaceae bacterium]|jgi:hypothetical protein|nr:hypothetical protein [Christensenellaceae bacterium]